MAFLLHRGIETGCLFGIIWLIEHYQLNITPQDFEVPSGFLHCITTVSAREMIIRVYIYLTAVAVPYCTLTLAHNLAAILTIFCGDVPAKWPPLFGSIGDAYTVRRFW